MRLERQERLGSGEVRRKMTVRRVVVCEAQVPFVHGGAEVHVRQLVRELRLRGYRRRTRERAVQVVPEGRDSAPRRGVAPPRSERSNGRPVDLLIATKFPTYFARHPNKVAWLIHQYRAAYELCGTEYSDFAHTELDVGLRDNLIRLDTVMLGECRRDIRQRPEHRRTRLRSSTACTPSRCTTRRSSRHGSTAGPVRRLRAVGRPHRIGQARRPHHQRDGSLSIPTSG